MKRGSRQIHKVIFVLLMIVTVWMSIGLVSAIEESVDGGWNLASGSNAEEDTELEDAETSENASPSDAEENDGTDSDSVSTPSDATPSEAEPGDNGQDKEDEDTSDELEWDPIPEFERDEHVVFEMKPLYLDANASTWDLLKGVSAHDQDGNALEVTLAEGEGNFYKASADYVEARSLSDSADGELATLRKGRYYEVVQAWDEVDSRMNKAARIIYVGSPGDFTQDKIPGVATGSDAALEDMELATGSNALKGVTFEMEPLYLSPTADVSAIDLTNGAKAVDEEGNELPVFLVDKGTFAEAYVGPGSRKNQLRSTGDEATETEETQQEGQTLVEGRYYVTMGAENSLDGSMGTAQRSVVVGNAAREIPDDAVAGVTFPVSGDVIWYSASKVMMGLGSEINKRKEVGNYKITIVGNAGGSIWNSLTDSYGDYVKRIEMDGIDGATLSVPGREYSPAGSLKFENITLDIPSEAAFVMRGNSFEIGENVSCINGENLKIYSGVRNKGDASLVSSDFSVVINSGTVGAIYAQSTEIGMAGIRANPNVHIQNAVTGKIACGVGSDEASSSKVQITDASVGLVSCENGEVSIQNSTVAGGFSLINSNSNILNVVNSGNLSLNGGITNIEESMTFTDCYLSGEYQLYLNQGDSITVTGILRGNSGTGLAKGTIYMPGNNILEGKGTGVTLNNIVSTGSNNVLKFPVGQITATLNNLNGQIKLDTSVGTWSDIVVPASGIDLIKYGENITADFIKQIEFPGVIEGSDIMASGSTLSLKNTVYSVIEPDGTKTAVTDIPSACILINTKETVGDYKLLLGEDIRWTVLAQTQNLGQHVNKLIIEGVGEERVIELLTNNSLTYFRNTEFNNVIIRPRNTAGSVNTNGAAVTFGDKTTVTVGITGNAGKNGTETDTTVIINKGATITGTITRGTATSMEIRFQEFEGTSPNIVGYNASMTEGTNIVIDSAAPITINNINGLGKLVLNQGSNLTVSNSITCQGSLGEVQFKGDCTLSLPGTETVQSQFGSMVIDGSNNRLELVPSNPSSGVRIPIQIVTNSSDQGGISGSGKLRLAPVGGKTSGSVGMNLMFCSTKTSAQSVYFEDEFDGGDLYVAADPITGYIRVSEPLKYIQVVNGNTKSYHSSLKKALQKIGLGTGNSYKVVFAKPGYMITSDDVKAFDEYGAFASEITYTGTYTLTSDDILQTGESVGKTVKRDIYIDSDIEFSSFKTSIEGIGITFNKSNSGIYAGGKNLTIGADVSFKGDKIPVLYGGSSKRNVTKTSVTVENGTFQAIYGGGNGTNVTGETSVTVTGAVTAETISGGSTGGGTVSGKRQIHLPDTNSFDSIIDFDELNLGSSSSGADITVSGTLDSDSGLAAGAVKNGTVHFEGGSTLTLSGTDGAVLAVGTLKNDSNPNNRLLLTKTASGVNSLMIAKCVNEAVGTPLKLGLASRSEEAEIMDQFLNLTNRSAVSANSFKLDGLSFNLFISKGSGTGGSLCLGLEADPGGELLKVVHQLADGSSTTPEDGTAKPGKKVFLQMYDVDMNDPTAAGAGLDTDTIYIDSSSALSQTWLTDDTIPDGGSVVEIEDPKGDGKHTWKGSTVIDEVDSSKIYYVHLKDKMGNYAIFPIDTLAPVKSEDVTIAAASGGFSVKLKLADQTKTSQSGIAYSTGGVSQAGWSLTEKDTESLSDDFSSPTLSDIRKVSPAANTYDYQFNVTAADMNGNSSKIIYVYVKDSYGNTSKISVPISQYIMNVSVPIKVGVVAVKGGEQPKLLTPDCYITNQGFFPIKISVETFLNQSENASNAIKVVDKSGGFGDDEINLKLLPLGAAASFAETPLAIIGEAAPLELGTIPGVGSMDNKLGFKFGADYDQNALKEFTGWEPFVMSYKFELATQN